MSAWVNPAITDQNIILQNLSASTAGPILKNGYDFYFSGASDPHVKFTLYSGSSEVSVSASYTSFTGSWNSVAVIYNNIEDLLYLYINENKQVSSSCTFGSIEYNTRTLLIGSGSQFSASYSDYDFYSGSLDEVRIFHSASELWNTKNFSRPVDGENDLKLRYSFNESIVGTASIDSVVVDYSQTGLHGNVENYAAGFRVSGAVMFSDPGDPILYSFQEDVVSFTSSLETSASLYDKDNSNYILNLVPEGIILEDETQEELMTSLVLVMARFFDEQKLFIDQFENLRITNYDDQDETPDLFLPTLKKYFGWKVGEHFNDSNPLQFFFGESILSPTGSIGTPLLEIRNQFWRRTLNNLPYLYKTKGKRHNIDAFLNTLGINKNVISIKEYGILPEGSIADRRIRKEKDVPFLGIGTGSLSSSYVRVPNFITASHNTFTVETFFQPPFASSSFSASYNEVSGAIWQFADREELTGSFTLIWRLPEDGSTSGSFVLTSSDGQSFSSSLLEVFDGDFVHVAAGLKSDQTPFIEVKTIDNDEIDFSASFSSSTALTGVFTGSNYDFVIGANSGSIFSHKTHGFFGHTKVWTRALTGSEIDDHALHFESIGVRDPLEDPYPLRGHWGLNEDLTSDTNGVIHGITDLSDNGFFATGSNFVASHNPYKRFLVEYTYLSPSVDVGRMDDKIRIRNKSELLLSDAANDLNELSLEFNLVDALNEDISKIFSTLELVNNAIGQPVNKYRDEYEDLEAYRRVYFDRLSDQLNFANFFKLFRWFDNKISNAIKQLLPARVRFIGGEQVVESHFLERPKYVYRYPIFKTPKDINVGHISASVPATGAFMNSLASDTMQGTYVQTKFEDANQYSTDSDFHVDPRKSSVFVQADIDKGVTMQVQYNDGLEIVDKITDNFARQKLPNNGKYILESNTALNFKNEHARRERQRLDRLNFDGNHSGSKVNSKLGNIYFTEMPKSIYDNSHYFHGARKNIRMAIRGLSGSNLALTGALFALTAAEGVELSQSLYDANNVLFDDTDFIQNVFGLSTTDVEKKHGAKLTFMVSASNATFNPSDISIEFKDDNSSAWSSYKDMSAHGAYFSQSLNWFKFESYLFSGSKYQPPSLSFSTANVHFRISASSNTYVFKDVKLEFDQDLIDGGVVEFRNKIRNQNTERISSFIKNSPLTKVDDS